MTRGNNLEAKVELPLGWQWSAIDSIKLEHVRLGRGKSWIYAAEIPQQHSLPEVLEELSKIFPQGWCARGCTEEFLQRLGTVSSSQLLLGSSANVSLTATLTSSVISLARRASRSHYAQEIDCASEARQTLDTLRSDSRYASLPALRLLFREGFSSKERAFAVRDSKTGQPQAFVSLTQYGEDAWHTEILLRSDTAPIGSMELLTSHIMTTLRKEGFNRLSLGEVPFYLEAINSLPAFKPGSKLEGLLRIALPPLLFPSFNIQGLYNFKNKFRPDWQPCYWVATSTFRASDMLWVAMHSNCLHLLARNILRKFKPSFEFLPPRGV